MGNEEIHVSSCFENHWRRQSRRRSVVARSTFAQPFPPWFIQLLYFKWTRLFSHFAKRFERLAPHWTTAKTIPTREGALRDGIINAILIPSGFNAASSNAFSMQLSILIEVMLEVVESTMYSNIRVSSENYAFLSRKITKINLFLSLYLLSRWSNLKNCKECGYNIILKIYKLTTDTLTCLITRIKVCLITEI